MPSTTDNLKKRAMYYAGLVLSLMFLSGFISGFISQYFTWAGSFSGYVTTFIAYLLIILIGEYAVKRMLSIT